MAGRRLRTRAELIERFQHVIPDAGRIDEVLGDDPGRTLADAVGTRASGRGPSDEDAETEARQRAFARTGEAAKSAVEKIRRDGQDADLTRLEIDGTEAIVELLGRPAILVHDGHFLPPPPPWEKLGERREAIETTLRSVGRIEIDGHPALDWVGTGFLVADDVVITNKHVAKEFALQSPDSQWVFESNMVPRMDFAEELAEDQPREFQITEVIGVSDTFDMAFLRAAKTSDAGELPPPLPMAPAEAVQEGREVYVIGYPASDSRRNDAKEQRRIFADIYDVKRLQPGEISGVQPSASLFTHDCSTLGGNSGSCVVDLETHAIVGLHFSGRYLESNRGIALAHCNDPLLREVGVEFN
jgi:S1-C subfamily serine protease